MAGQCQGPGQQGGAIQVVADERPEQAHFLFHQGTLFPVREHRIEVDHLRRLARPGAHQLDGIALLQLHASHDGRDFNVLSYKTWRVSDIATKYQLIRGGLGWGGLPASLVREDLQAGRLVALQLDAYEQGEYPIYALRKIANPPGPAANWLIQAFREQLSNCPSPDEIPGLDGGRHRPAAE